MPKILKINSENPEEEKIKLAREVLNKGKIIIYPTDTVYGIGCSIQSKNINKIFNIKKRKRNPLSVAFPDMKTLKEYVTMDDEQEEFINKNQAKAYTFILKKKGTCKIKIPDEITFGETVGVRIPNNKIVKELIKNSHPIITTSANISGNPAAASYDEIADEIKDNCDVSLIIDSGRCKIGKPSVVVDLTRKPFKFLRE